MLSTLIDHLREASAALPYIRTQEEVQHLRETLRLLLDASEVQERRLQVLADLGQPLEYIQ